MASRTVIANVVSIVSIGVIVGVTGFLLVYDPGYIARVYGWMFLAVVALIFWAAYENLGQRVLDSQFFSRMSSSGRVLFGVPVVLGLLALGYGGLWVAGVAIKWLSGSAS
ncbi:MAG: hypothetical protein NDI88_16315 [Lysobacter sp.]|nr:hypothetical protein [Lysobacter sp.]